MYRTAKGEEIFVIDGHTHFWDGSPANQKNIHGKQFIECFYAYHSNLSPPSEKWEKEKFEKYDAKTMFDDLFVTGYDDMAILQPIWSQPRVKVATFGDALGHAKNRIRGIASELGLKVPANLAS